MELDSLQLVTIPSSPLDVIMAPSEERVATSAAEHASAPVVEPVPSLHSGHASAAPIVLSATASVELVMTLSAWSNRRNCLRTFQSPLWKNPY